MNSDLARHNMIQQARTWHVSDHVLLDLLKRVPREQFVPPAFHELAFVDTFIPIGHNQVILPPNLVARLLQALTITNEDSILEIGTGTGYMAALCSRLGKIVTSVEIIPELTQIASKNFKTLKIHNISLETVNGINGWEPHAPYDVIILSGSVPYIPKALGQQLKIHGRLIAVIGSGHAMQVTLLIRTGDATWKHNVLFETEIPPLIGLPKSNNFRF